MTIYETIPGFPNPLLLAYPVKQSQLPVALLHNPRPEHSLYSLVPIWGEREGQGQGQGQGDGQGQGGVGDWIRVGWVVWGEGCVLD